MFRPLDILTSVLASSFRSWHGTSGSKTVVQPDESLILFDREGCPKCRFVREALTELNLNVMIAPCPVGGRNISNLRSESGSDELPLLVDNNTGEKVRGKDRIVEYLFRQYRGVGTPDYFKSGALNRVTSRIATLVRLNAGIIAKESLVAEKPLTLYSFESSPFSRIVRETLCELELPYYLINLGKQQWADMRLGNPSLDFRKYKPLANTKRERFYKKHGNVQVPYLIDPNTGKELFESQDIVEYLTETYYLSDRK